MSQVFQRNVAKKFVEPLSTRRDAGDSGVARPLRDPATSAVKFRYLIVGHAFRHAIDSKLNPIVVDDSLYAVLEVRNMEIDQQPDFTLAQF